MNCYWNIPKSDCCYNNNKKTFPPPLKTFKLTPKVIMLNPKPYSNHE